MNGRIAAHRAGYVLGFSDGIEAAALRVEAAGGQQWRKRLAAELRAMAAYAKASDTRNEQPTHSGLQPGTGQKFANGLSVDEYLENRLGKDS